jgi:uncharacterized protein involved in exopolysaccharide biosynthesis
MNDYDDDDLTSALTRLGEWQPPTKVSRDAVKRARERLIDRAIPLQPLEIVWRRKGFVALCALAGLLLGFLYYINKTPIYESTAKLVVVKGVPPFNDRPPDQGALAEDIVATNIVMLQSPVVIDRAIRKAKLNELKTLEGVDPLATIRASFLVRRDQPSPGNNIIVTSYRGPIPEDCRQILIGIHDAFQDFLLDRAKQKETHSVAVLSPPRIGEKVTPVAYQYLWNGLMLGLFLGVGLAYLTVIANRAYWRIEIAAVELVERTAT